tara:strand:- start:396 stop:1427 length:1032 start_codon:yes stop_codon:yes gene_type:complete
MKFKAAILKEIKKPLVIDEISFENLNYGQVFLKIIETGICRSQIFEIDGLRGHDKWLPHLLGHEALAEVVDIGPGVTKVKVGEKVIATWIKSSGISAEPAKYKIGKQIINSGRVTTFSEFSICSEDRCVLIRNLDEYKVGAPLGCAIPTGYGLSLTLKDIKKANFIGILGLGGIGMSALLGIINETDANVGVIDIQKDRLEKALNLGAKYSFLPSSKKGLSEQIMEKSGRLFDIVIECTGTINALNNSLTLIHDNGLVKFVTHPPYGNFLEIDPFELIKGKKIEGSWGGGIDPDKHLEYIASKVSQNQKFLDLFTSACYKLENINQAIDEMKKMKTLRPIIRF